MNERGLWCHTRTCSGGCQDSDGGVFEGEGLGRGRDDEGSAQCVGFFDDEGVACHGRANPLLAKRRKRKGDDQGQENEDSHDPTKNGL